MTNKINSITAICITLAIALACSFSTANLSEIKFDTDKSGKNAKTTFDPNDEIVAITAVNNAAGKNKVKFRLLFDNVEGAKSGELAYEYEKEIEVDGSREVYFGFRVPGGIAPGKYKGEAVLTGDGGKEFDRKTATFNVSGGKNVSKKPKTEENTDAPKNTEETEETTDEDY